LSQHLAAGQAAAGQADDGDGFVFEFGLHLFPGTGSAGLL